MGFFKKLFGGGPKEYVDTQGLYFYVMCDNCGAKVRIRADKQHDLNRTDGGFVWHKTIVDNRCFRRMETVVHLDSAYNITDYDLTGGRFITQAEYEAPEEVVEEELPEDEEEDIA
jgi:hypothetical protein